MRGFEELEAAVLHERHVAPDELDLEHVAVMGAAEQHRVPAQRAADLARREDLVDDVLRLRGGIVERDVDGLLLRLTHPEQGLAVLPRALGHERIRRVENRLRGAVVLRQHHRVGLRLEALGEAEDVLHRRGTERIDRLRIVAHHGHARPVGLERLDDLALQRARVLVLIDEHVIEIRGETLRERRILHHPVPVEQQIVEVEDVVLLLARDVFTIDLGEVLLPLAHPGKLFLEGLLERKARVHAIAVDREARILARKALFLARITRARDGSRP